MTRVEGLRTLYYLREPVERIKADKAAGRKPWEEWAAKGGES